MMKEQVVFGVLAAIFTVFGIASVYVAYDRSSRIGPCADVPQPSAITVPVVVDSCSTPGWMTNGVYIPCITSLNQYIGTTKWIRVDPAEYDRFFRGYYSVTSGWDSLVSQLPVLE